MKKRSFESPLEFARFTGGVLRRSRALGDVYLRGRLRADDRERIMVAVSRVNSCEGCTRVHERWALRTGVSDAELRSLEIGDLAGLDARGRAAVIYASARAEDGFPGSLSPEAAAASSGLTRREVLAVEAVARAMTLANLTVNTTGSLRHRLRSRPAVTPES